MREFEIGRIYGLRITATPAVIPGVFIVWIPLAVVGLNVLGLSVPEAMWGGLIGVALHYASELWHHTGHAWAARRTGHPMIGVRFGFLFGVAALSIYPPDEGDLPAAVHLRRALGGPLFCLLLALAALPLALAVQRTGGLAYWLAAWLFLENLLIYALQGIIPVGFNDGQIVWEWILRRGKGRRA